ncbi:MAG: lipoyl(octanoyl) transferase LipB [Candidatus Omnitrophica bacterium]|nr:lipoyl(octanoyl) transferase LipB [Candidatus Omnitrophota bacterium]
MICDLGLTDYEYSYRFQKEFVTRRKLGEIEDSIIITEHTPVFTIGRVGNPANLLVDENSLVAQGIKVMRVDRGGDITCHMPGQLVVYPVIDLKKRTKDLRRYLRDLEEVAINFLARFGILAVRIEGMTGVWVDGKKITSIGVGASDWVTYHGMSINIRNDLHYFSMINPCGMPQAKATSIETILSKTVDMNEAKLLLIREFYRVFSLQHERLAN